MTELKKGDLVMTQYGLGYLDKYWEQLCQWEVDLLNGKIAFVQHPTKATREQVEAYLKEKGYISFKSGCYWRMPSIYLLIKGNNGYGVAQDATIWDYDFDTAQEQLSEAITMAKLLNATKL